MSKSINNAEIISQFDRILGTFDDNPNAVLCKLNNGKFLRLYLDNDYDTFDGKISKSSYNLLRGGNVIIKEIYESKLKLVNEILKNKHPIEYREDDFDLIELNDPNIEKGEVKIIKGK